MMDWIKQKTSGIGPLAWAGLVLLASVLAKQGSEKARRRWANSD